MFFLAGSVVHDGVLTQEAGPFYAVDSIFAADGIHCLFKILFLLKSGVVKRLICEKPSSDILPARTPMSRRGVIFQDSLSRRQEYS